MKESIYACLFSSGLIKVGRSIDPKSRIASHQERLSCAGIELVNTHFLSVDGCVFACERELIRRCSEASTKRYKSEWFDGLDFAMVSAWIDEIAASDLLGNEETKIGGAFWNLLVSQILATGISQKQLGDRVGKSQAWVSAVLRNEYNEPRWLVGQALLAVYAEVVGVDFPSLNVTKEAA